MPGIDDVSRPTYAMFAIGLPLFMALASGCFIVLSVNAAFCYTDYHSTRRHNYLVVSVGSAKLLFAPVPAEVEFVKVPRPLESFNFQANAKLCKLSQSQSPDI